MGDIISIVEGPWKEWKSATTNTMCLEWLVDVGPHLPKCEEDLIATLKGE